MKSTRLKNKEIEAGFLAVLVPLSPHWTTVLAGHKVSQRLKSLQFLMYRVPQKEMQPSHPLKMCRGLMRLLTINIYKWPLTQSPPSFGQWLFGWQHKPPWVSFAPGGGELIFVNRCL